MNETMSPQRKPVFSENSIERPIIFDVIILMLVGAGAYIISFDYNLFDWLHELSKTRQHWDAHELASGLLTLLIGTVVFAVRRVFDQKNEIARRNAAELRLISFQDDLQRRVDEATEELRVKALEAERALAREKELNELQRQFVSMASHEFRTPLAIIDITAQRMMRRADRLTPEDFGNRIQEIRDAVERMTHLMESTLASARMESGELSIEFGPCDIRSLVVEVCSSYQSIAEDHVISCDVANLPKTINADAGAVRQILTNLLSNAVKYAPDAPDIEITAATKGEHISLSVRDYGLGIKDEDLPHMFERFFRAKSVATIAGTGLGLNLVKTLAEKHGGSVKAESEVGVGSTFTIRLPVLGPVESAVVEANAAQDAA